ncbi:hypothetical protein [Paenibacillus donghaensis]|uniref:Major tropism determinant N-terminal domain-containing protein n=1 Tax=Paenibacillus donghaensis TaxID=414771 RepID=A0A2Z2K7C0_9BACL|nr:hypothetical protein [Paenibacillus donghaensis]ASA22306.1 hypothetical protein B9T62_16845 [Paenibacillus donghaensis]
MANKIQVRRGTKAQLAALGGLAVGEPGYCTDTKDLYVGNASGPDTLFPAAENILYNKNQQALINGGFEIWQRGTSVLPGGDGSNAYGYGPDRWWSQIYAGSVTGNTSSWVRQDFAAGQTVVPGNPKHFARFNILTLSALQTQSLIRFHQAIEDVRNFAGQKVTFTIWVKANAARAVGVLAIQNFGSGGSAEVHTAAEVPTVNLTTAWQKVTVSISVPSIAGKTVGDGSYLALSLVIHKAGNTIISAPSGVVGSWSTGYVDIAQAQVNIGAVALPYQPRSLADELALCQRYYEKSYYLEDAPGTATENGSLYGVSEDGTVGGPHFGYTSFKTRKRVTPTVTAYGKGGGVGMVSDGTADRTISSGVACIGDEAGIRHNYTLNGSTTNRRFFHFAADAEL